MSGIPPDGGNPQTKRLQWVGKLRKFSGMKTTRAAVGFRHLRRPWVRHPGWVAV